MSTEVIHPVNRISKAASAISHPSNAASSEKFVENRYVSDLVYACADELTNLPPRTRQAVHDLAEYILRNVP